LRIRHESQITKVGSPKRGIQLIHTKTLTNIHTLAYSRTQIYLNSKSSKLEYGYKLITNFNECERASASDREHESMLNREKRERERKRENK